MSTNLLLENAEEPVVWRGPILAGMIKQFWSDVRWGEVDYMFVDMPPGTGDVSLTVMQSIPLTGVVMVSIPQDMVSMIVNKSINMTKMLKVPVLGVVENMSYILCPHCGEKISLHEKSSVDDFLHINNIELLGELPTDISVANMANNGDDQIKEEIAKEFTSITDKVLAKIK